MLRNTYTLFLMRYRIKNQNMTSHGLRTPGEEIAFTARPKIKPQSQISSATSAQNFRFFRFMPSLGVRSPCDELLLARSFNQN